MQKKDNRKQMIPWRKAAERYFRRDQDDKAKWKRSCGSIVKKWYWEKKERKGTGYTNLISHLQNNHPYFVEDENIKTKLSLCEPSSSKLLFSPLTKYIYEWFDFIISNLLLIFISRMSFY